jgi:TIR domain
VARFTVTSKPPDAFLSYTRFDDRRERGKISQFRQELEDEVRAVTGEAFKIFQDSDDIDVGERWSDKLDQILDMARFFIPILTPSYFNSPACRDELAKFLEAEERAGRRDLILPIYYIQCAVLENQELRKTDNLATIIYQRQRWDWRDLRHSDFRPRKVRLQLQRLAEAIAIARQTRVPRPADVVSPTTLGSGAMGLASPGVVYNDTWFEDSIAARWAVFFDNVGLKFEYQKWCDVDGVRLLPDFWLPDLGFWFEVTSEEPGGSEKARCQALADATDHIVLMAVGAPEPRDQLLAFSSGDTTGEGAFPRQEEVRFYFADDRRNEGEFWLLSDAGAAASIGPRTGPDHGKPPGVYGATRRGYEAVSMFPLLNQPVNETTLEIYTKQKYPGLPVNEKIQRLLLRDLDKARYTTIGCLDRVVNAASDAVDKYRNEKPEWFKSGTDYLTKSLGFTDNDFRERHGFAPQTREAFLRYGDLMRSTETRRRPRVL